MEKPTLKDYAKAVEIGVSKKYVDQRMEELDWSSERAITTPVGPVLPVGPIELGFNAAEDKNSSNIIYL
ncbi:hypothetical protein COI88_13605 [Bacillus cereus]|nr:hypothetical protein COI88_13605 [Bacillus cereus]